MREVEKHRIRHRMTFVKHPEYDVLPEVVKANVPAEEHAWMGDEARNRLIEDLTLPEVGYCDD